MSDTAHNDATYEPAAAEAPNVLQQAWWLTLGLLTTIGEGTTKAAEVLIEKGRTVDPKVAEPVKRAASEVSGAARDAGQRVKRAAADFAGRGRAAAGPARPTAEEFDQLKEDVRELRARVMADGAETPDA